MSNHVHTKSTIFFFSCDLTNFLHTGTQKAFFEHVQRNRKRGIVEESGFCRSECGGGVELPDRNGLVPHEDERYGRHEVRRAAKRVRLRKSQASHHNKDHEARECVVFLALAAARPGVPGARDRKRGARIAVGSEPAKVS